MLSLFLLVSPQLLPNTFIPPNGVNCKEETVVNNTQVTLVITGGFGHVTHAQASLPLCIHKALNLCQVNPEASQHEI